MDGLRSKLNALEVLPIEDSKKMHDRWTADWAKGVLKGIDGTITMGRDCVTFLLGGTFIAELPSLT